MRSTVRFREISEADIPALFVVRVATHENRLSREELTAMGITETSILARLRGSCKGWLAEQGQQVVGFAIGDRSSGELWVIAVLPAYLGQGIGSQLLQRVEAWLAAHGCTQLWLTTDVDVQLRAYSFYRQHGWVDSKIEAGLRYMTKVVQR